MESREREAVLLLCLTYILQPV